MRVGIHRSTRGIGDMIMMEPLFAMLCNKHSVDRLDLHVSRTVSDVHRYHPLVSLIDECKSHDGFDRSAYPQLDHVYDLSDACFKHELAHQPNVTKNRTEIWANACGLRYFGRPSPKLWLSGADAVTATKRRLQGPPTIAAGYASVDAWRSYPHMTDLVLELAKFARVWVFHDQKMESLAARMPSDGSVELFEGIPLREMFWRVKACRLVVSADTALVHVGGAQNVPVYAIFGPTDADVRMSDYFTRWEATPAYRTCGRAPCWYQPCKGAYCLSTLHPKDLARDVKRLWGEAT